MDGAAQFNHFHIVRWLADHRSEGCSSSAFDWDAKNNNLEMLEFLYERYRSVLGAETGPGTPKLVSSNKQIIEWLAARELLEQNSLIKHIASTGKIDSLAWAIERFDVKLTEDHLEDAYRKQHTALLKWAFTAGGVEFGPISASHTAYSCNTNLMNWVISRDRSVIPILLRGCSGSGHVSLVEWWRVRHGVVFGQNELETAVARCNRDLIWHMISEDDGSLDLDAALAVGEQAVKQEDDSNFYSALLRMTLRLRDAVAQQKGLTD
ncbi:hypothetical protein HK105_208696 [Polyrhizophydium stewartii]|uniref:Uncharacterized protein n=1 Tax=Polyrhizophydium stewartii TaxID=2732419 RepID=A0ABR4MX41_9FUNG